MFAIIALAIIAGLSFGVLIALAAIHVGALIARRSERRARALRDSWWAAYSATITDTHREW